MITLNQTLGYYNPAFFKLYIRTLNQITLNNLSPSEMTTFIHEYTHFLQDFTTIKGLQNIYNTFEWLSLYVNDTYDTRKLKIPYHSTHPVLNINQEISNITWGRSVNLHGINKLSNITITKVSISPDILSRYPQLSTFRTVIADAELNNGRTVTIEIGTLAVMESMAHLSESLMGLTPTASPHYPYHTVRLMADALCGALHLSDEILFAVCDIALQCTIPGVGVCEMLQGFTDGAYPVPNDGYDVYAVFGRAFDEWSNQDAKGIVNLAKKHLLELVHAPAGLRYQAWVENMIEKAVMWRTSHPSFLLDAFRWQDKYVPIVNLVGTPLMVNAVEDYSKVPANLPGVFPVAMDVEFYTSVSYIMNLYQLGDRKCPMQQWCINSGINVDINCTIDPPSRADISQYPSLCPVGVLWRGWNLSRWKLNLQYIFRPFCRK